MQDPPDRQEVERVLQWALPAPLAPKELAELIARLRSQEEQLALLRALPLDEEEPWLPSSAEERP
jgi:hypothetical protein